MKTTDTQSTTPAPGVGCGALLGVQASKHWPCPNNCMNWCRTGGSMTNHHPRCEYVDESLMDVWSVRIPGEAHGCIVDTEAQARAMASEDPDAPLEVVALRMHRELVDALPEFNGF